MSMFVNRPGSGSGGGGTPSFIVIDSLESTSTTDALSANQGKILKDLVDELDTKFTTSENLKVFDTELYGMRVFNGEFQYLNTTTSQWVTIQGGSSIAGIVDDLISTDVDKALSANQGRVLNEKITTHESKVASSTELGHVKIDDITIKYNPNGQLYVVEQAGEPINLENYQKVLTTTVVNQTEWDIPLADYNKEKDTILVSHNTTLLTNEMYEITGVYGAYKVKINVRIPSEIDKNNVFIVILRNAANTGGNGGSGTTPQEPTLTKIYQFELETTVESQKTWKIPLDTFNPNKDHLVVYHNSTYVPPSMWTITANPSGGYDVNLPYDMDIAISENQTDIVIFSNYPAGLDDFINGTVILDKSITINKLSQEVQDKLNSIGQVEIATTEKLGVIKPDGITLSVDSNGVLSNMFMPSIKHYQTTKIDDPLDASKKIFLLDFERLETDFLEVVFNDVILDITDFEFITVQQGSAIRLNITNMVDYSLAYVHGFLYRGFNILR